MLACDAKVAASVILLAVSVFTFKDIKVTVPEGSDFITAIETKEAEVSNCRLITPNGDVIYFNTIQNEVQNDKYEFNVSDELRCSVLIKHIDDSDNGVWVLTYDNKDDDKQLYDITVSKDITSNSYKPVEHLTHQRIDTELGKSHTIVINLNSLSTTEACFLEDPSGEIHTLSFNSEIPGIEVLTGNNIECAVRVTVSRDLIGEWTLIGWSLLLSSHPMEKRLPFTIYVEDIDGYDSNIDRRVLQQIDHVTRLGAYIDMSLSKISDEEDCYIVPPKQEPIELSKVQINGVTVQSSSNYVNCRVTIGPMEQNLIGIWTLCGRRNENIERCQPANITWYSDTDVSKEWTVNPVDTFEYLVNFRGIISPTVDGIGDLLACHVVTPDGEDLALTIDTDYPGLQRDSWDYSICKIDIGPIDESMLGDWVIYSKVHSQFFGFSENRFSFTFSLYNEDDPYSQAYNVSTLGTIKRSVNMGNTVSVDVTGSGSVDDCYYTTPTGFTYYLSSSESYQGASLEKNGVTCRLTLTQITEAMLGHWQLFAKYSRNGIFTEKRQSIQIIREDPANPIIDEVRRIIDLDAQNTITDIGGTNYVSIPRYALSPVQSCHLRTPQGLQYELMEGFHLPGVQIEYSADAACRVSLTILNEDMVGEWTLIARILLISEPVEQRLRYTVQVEENVEAFPSDLTIIEGNDLHVRLRHTTDLAATCRLIAPNENTSYDVDAMHENACGFVVRGIDQAGSGHWEIVYGTAIIYKAAINVTVIEKQPILTEDLVLYKHRAVNQTIGPENPVYCRLQDPQGVTVYEDFGVCKLVIDRVSSDHRGQWVMIAGLLGQVVAERHTFNVDVIEEEEKQIVITHVEKQQPEVIISCSLPGSELRMCKFRDPSGQVLLASPGVGEHRYVVHGTEVGIESELNSHECGIRITNPRTSDLGIWRCAVETDSRTYFGFLPVLCPWALQDPEVQASVTTEPILTAERTVIHALEGDSVTMSCSVQAPIRYCYFRKQNGSTYSIGPGTSTAAMEYIGGGLEAGECGVRFRNLVVTDSGPWSCHVGLTNDTAPEQMAQLHVFIESEMLVSHRYSELNELIIESRVVVPGTLDYCRFVRIDGFGFTSQNVPEGYSFIGSYEGKYCALRMAEHTILNLHPWVIAAKIVGRDTEIVRTTTDNLLTVPPDQRPEPSGESNQIYLWVIVCLLSSIILTLLLFVFKVNKTTIKNRTHSLMNSFRRKPPPYQVS